MKVVRKTLLVSAALVALAAPAFSHHSFAAEYDEKKPIVLKGVVTKLDWRNPHVRFYVDAKDDQGTVTSWDLELQSPNTLTRAGWNRSSLKEGDQVTVSAYLAKDGSKRANARGGVQLANGKKLFAGDPDDGGPAK
jgi:hypothetical protein